MALKAISRLFFIMESESYQTLFSDEELDLCSPSGRTYPESLLPIKGETLARSSSRFLNCGLILSTGESWMGDTSVSPNHARESSLWQILEPEVEAKFFVTPRQAAYALRRSQTMGWNYPEEVFQELSRLALLLDQPGPTTS
jgi:hypothetical protein